MLNSIIIIPRAFLFILLVAANKKVGGFLVHIPQQLLLEAQSRAIDFGIQYGAMAIGQGIAGSKFIDPAAPTKLFGQGIESLSTTSSPQEAASRGTIAAAV